MWIYEKKLEYPVKIKKCNPALAKIIIAQYGGADCIGVGFFKLIGLYFENGGSAMMAWR